MSDMQRFFPMSIFMAPYDDEEESDDDIASIDRQMRLMQQEMDAMTSKFQRLKRRRSSSTPGSGANAARPLDVRKAEDMLALNPVVTDKEGRRKMRLNFDVRCFKPEEISVTTKEGGKYLDVQAKHEDETENGKIMRHYHRLISLPSGVQLDAMCSTINPEGILVILAPIRGEDAKAAVEGARKEQPIAIQHE